MGFGDCFSLTSCNIILREKSNILKICLEYNFLKAEKNNPHGTGTDLSFWVSFSHLKKAYIKVGRRHSLGLYDHV